MDRKRVIIKITVVFLVLLIVCTFLSRSIYGLLLPKVTTDVVKMDVILKKAYSTGVIQLSNRKEILSNGDWKIEEIYVKEGQSVSEGTPLIKVDINDIIILEKELELQRQTLEDTSVWGSKEISRKEAQLEIYDLKLKQLRNNMPEDGIITTDTAGEIEKIEWISGDRIQEQDIICTIVPVKPEYVIETELGLEEGSVFQEGVNIYGKIDLLKEKNGQISVSAESFDCSIKNIVLTEQNTWKYTLLFDELPGIKDGQALDVVFSNKTEMYKAVVPAEAVKENSDGTYYVLVLESREGLFGEELIVRQVFVTIKDTNGFQTAVEGNLYETQKVITSTTKDLYDGATVKVDLS